MFIRYLLFKSLSAQCFAKLLFSPLILGFSVIATATDIDMGEYDSMPAGTNTFLMYYKGARFSETYLDGDKVSDKTRLISNAGVLRYSRFGKIGKYLVSMPQFILPFGELEGRGNLSQVGDTQGIGDLAVPMPVFLINDTSKRRTFVINPIVHVPIGSYDNDRALNFGSNRWRYELQVGGTTAIAEKWNLDVVAGVEFFQDNTDFTSNSLTLEQDPRYKAQVLLNYLHSAEARFAVGLFHTMGGETAVDGVEQDNELSTTRFSLSAATNITPIDQILVSIGKDLSVRNGLKEDGRLTLRWLHLF